MHISCAVFRACILNRNTCSRYHLQWRRLRTSVIAVIQSLGKMANLLRRRHYRWIYHSSRTEHTMSHRQRRCPGTGSLRCPTAAAAWISQRQTLPFPYRLFHTPRLRARSCAVCRFTGGWTTYRQDRRHVRPNQRSGLRHAQRRKHHFQVPRIKWPARFRALHAFA